MLSGGDTASLVCRALGVRRIQLEDEIAPGIPWGNLSGGAFDGRAWPPSRADSALRCSNPSSGLFHMPTP